MHDSSITEPPKMDPQRMAFARQFLPHLMGVLPPEGRDLMFTVDNVGDIARTREVLDWLEFWFIKETGGTVERSPSNVKRGKTHLMAIFRPKGQDNGGTNGSTTRGGAAAN